MTRKQLQLFLAGATEAAHLAGDLMRKNLRKTKKIHQATRHDIKLELDVRCQKTITQSLASAFPDVPVLGEEKIDPRSENAALRWVVDPIDGTVNYAQGIPHAAVSIALQSFAGPKAEYPDGFTTIVGVIYDPFQNELWTAIQDQPSRLNGRPIRVSQRKKLADSVVTLGFAKSEHSLNHLVQTLGTLVHRVRKIRIMGSAALALAYVADGRFDAFIEAGLRLWDIGAGGLIVQNAGGHFGLDPLPEPHAYEINAHNGLLGRSLASGFRTVPKE